MGRARPQPPQSRQDRRRARPAAQRRHHPLRRHREDVRQLVLDEDGADQVEARGRHARVSQGRRLHPHEGGVRPQLPAPCGMGHAREGRGCRTGPRQLRRVPDERLRAPGAGLLRDRSLEGSQPQPELRRRSGRTRPSSTRAAAPASGRRTTSSSTRPSGRTARKSIPARSPCSTTAS